MSLAMATPTISLLPLSLKSHHRRRRLLSVPMTPPCSPVTASPPSRSLVAAASGGGGDAGDGAVSLVASLRSQYNDIMVVDTGDSRVLLLDSTHNIHSILNKEQKWTGSYWLHEDSTWLELRKKLMPNGRIMVNCSGAHCRTFDGSDRAMVTDLSLNDSWVQNSTIEAMSRSFPGELSWKRIKDEENDNFLALTGPLPDLNAWSSALPSPLRFNVKQWKLCQHL